MPSALFFSEDVQDRFFVSHEVDQTKYNVVVDCYWIIVPTVLRLGGGIKLVDL